jgi:hypothetical protein
VPRFVPLVALWAALATVLSLLAERVRDWNAMTDELVYERLAISIAQTGSPLPRLHGELIRSLAQLYPLLLSPWFLHGYVPGDLTNAHVFDAWLMSSACIPAFLLARRVTGRPWVAYLLALLTVCVPWIVLTTTLLTEVAAYPAFLWALLAMQRALAAPSPLNDVVALAACALAFFARTELIVLVVVLPAALVAYELGRRTTARRVVRAHRVLAAAYVVILAGGLALAETGHLSRIVGIYGVYSQNASFLSSAFFGSLLEHAATFALALAVVPALVGGAWLLANLLRPAAATELHAFACVGSLTIGAAIVQATDFDVQYTGYVHDRFLLYLAPVVVIGVLCAMVDARRPRWSLLPPAALVATGFAVGAIPVMTWSNAQDQLLPDTPASIIYDLLVHGAHTLRGARVTLVVATILATLLLLQATFLLRRRWVSGVLTAVLVACLPATTSYVLLRYLSGPSWSSRPLTSSAGSQADWVDQVLGSNASVTFVPFPVSTDYFVSQQQWRDLEFWNKSLQRDAHYPEADVFEYTGIWFPKLYLSFDQKTGATSASPTQWVAQSDKETRFRVAGTVKAVDQDVVLIDAPRPWRLQWLGLGLYDDGWTQPGVTARVRIFPAPGQRVAQTRSLFIAVRAPDDVPKRPVNVVSNLATWHGVATNGDTVEKSIFVCVPAHGYTDVRISTPDASTIPGDLRDSSASSGTRRGGVSLRALSLADEVGGPCAQ